MKDFDKLIWRDAITLVDFFAVWCGPCRAMHPVIDRFRERMNGRAEVVKIDIDSPEDAAAVARYGVAAVPTRIFFRRGEILWRGSGAMDYDCLVRIFEQVEQRVRSEAR